MAPGQRVNQLTRADLTTRLESAQPGAWSTLSKTTQRKKSLPALLGHAIHYGLVNKAEVEETTPKEESTMPCYLYTYVTDAAKRQKIQEYVVAASKLFRRGSLITNIVAQSTCGPRLPGAGDVR